MYLLTNLFKAASNTCFPSSVCQTPSLTCLSSLPPHGFWGPARQMWRRTRQHQDSSKLFRQTDAFSANLWTSVGEATGSFWGHLVELGRKQTAWVWQRREIQNHTRSTPPGGKNSWPWPHQLSLSLMPLAVGPQVLCSWKGYHCCFFTSHLPTYEQDLFIETTSSETSDKIKTTGPMVFTPQPYILTTTASNYWVFPKSKKYTVPWTSHVWVYCSFTMNLWIGQ